MQALLSALIGFILGQIVKFFIEPIHEQRKLIGSILETLTFYQNCIFYPGSVDDDITEEDINSMPANQSIKKRAEAEDTLRKHASAIVSLTYATSLYWFWELLRLVRPKESLKKAHDHLIFLSNSVRRGNASENREEFNALVLELGLCEYFKRN